MSRLNQIVAVVNGKKTRAEKKRDEVYKNLQKPAPFSGILRTYRPDQEDGPTFPDERKYVQATVQQSVIEFEKFMTELIDVTATLDVANCAANADVVVNGKTILPKMPITHLMFLEKQLTHVATFISHMPILDPVFQWNWSDETNCYRSEPQKTIKTQKIPTAFERSPATKEHPAQVDRIDVDTKIGEWSTTHLSGAIPAQMKEKYLDRANTLLDAVREAREQANQFTIGNNEKVAKKVFEHVFQG